MKPVQNPIAVLAVAEVAAVIASAGVAAVDAPVAAEAADGPGVAAEAAADAASLAGNLSSAKTETGPRPNRVLVSFVFGRPFQFCGRVKVVAWAPEKASPQ